METQVPVALSAEQKRLWYRMMSFVEERGSPWVYPVGFAPVTGCWTHTTVPTSAGYGQFMMNGESYNLHRLSWWLHNGCPAAPHNFHDSRRWHVSHLCDNKECCNPSHLELQPVGQNVADGVARCRPKKPVVEPTRNSEPCYGCVEAHRSCDGGVPCARCKEQGLECVKKGWKPHAATFKAGECSGENNAACKLTDAKLLEFHARVQSGLPHGGLKKLAAEFGISYPLAQKIKGGTYARLVALLSAP